MKCWARMSILMARFIKANGNLFKWLICIEVSLIRRSCFSGLNGFSAAARILDAVKPVKLVESSSISNPIIERILEGVFIQPLLWIFSYELLIDLDSFWSWLIVFWRLWFRFETYFTCQIQWFFIWKKLSLDLVFL